MLPENEILWSLTVLTMRPESASQGPGSAGDAATNWKNEDARKTIYMTLAGFQRPLLQQTANAFYLGTISSFVERLKG